MTGICLCLVTGINLCETLDIRIERTIMSIGILWANEQEMPFEINISVCLFPTYNSMCVLSNENVINIPSFKEKSP